jgi:hypothetical protein
VTREESDRMWDEMTERDDCQNRCTAVAMGYSLSYQQRNVPVTAEKASLRRTTADCHDYHCGGLLHHLIKQPWESRPVALQLFGPSFHSGWSSDSTPGGERSQERGFRWRDKSNGAAAIGWRICQGGVSICSRCEQNLL